MIEKHYRTRELADLLACHEETILRLAQKGELVSVFVGSERRYPESAVRAYLERKTSRGNVVAIARSRNDRASQQRRTS